MARCAQPGASDRSAGDGGAGPDQLLPSVVVNADGVVLVTWYERRDAGGSLCWRLRAAASLDGGETHSASEPVTEAANASSGSSAWDVRGTG